MNITSAKYCINLDTNENSSIKATIDGVEMFVPISEGNIHYDEIMRQVNAGTLTVTAA
tara:strand:- start:47 stop:220 length:174 start_codon:yes stop_codon:yes gene_type:complete